MSGFSLMELLIAMFIFSLIILSAVAVFAGVVGARKKSRDMQQNLEQARTAMEMMARNMRMSTELKTYASSKGVYMYNNSQSTCIAYLFSGSALRTASYSKPCSTVPSSLSDLISSDVSDGQFKVVETDSASVPGKIGKATIVLTIGSGSSQKHLQTSVSFRDYDGVLYNVP